MLLNAQEVESYLLTNNKGKRAQVGYDLTVKSINQVHGGSVYKDQTVLNDYTPIHSTVFRHKGDDLITKDVEVYRLLPGTYSLTFEQGCKLPTNITAFIRHRSSILRSGGIITSGVFDPGFEVDEMGAILIATKGLTIEKGARVAQIIMMENMEAEAYAGQWQAGSDVK